MSMRLQAQPVCCTGVEMASSTLRPAGPDDAPALSELAEAAYRRYVPRLGKPPAPMMADYTDVIANTETWVLEDDGRLTGLLVLRPRGDHLLVDNIAVHPDVQGRGLGGRLLAHAERRAAQLRLLEIRLYTNEAMTENLGFYAEHGYEETHRAEQEGFRRVFFSKLL